MKLATTSRRRFLKSAVGTAVGTAASCSCARFPFHHDEYEALDAAANRPVLKRELFNGPVFIKALDLLRYQDNFIMRAISQDGAVGYAISNNAHMRYLYPLLLLKVAPFF